MDKKNWIETSIVQEQMGSEITLYDQDDQEYVFHLLLELQWNDKHYAYLQSPEDEDGDIEVMRVIKTDDGEIDLESVEDDDEWEEAAELFDEWTYSNEG